MMIVIKKGMSSAALICPPHQTGQMSRILGGRSVAPICLAPQWSSPRTTSHSPRWTRWQVLTKQVLTWHISAGQGHLLPVSILTWLYSVWGPPLPHHGGGAQLRRLHHHHHGHVNPAAHDGQRHHWHSGQGAQHGHHVTTCALHCVGASYPVMRSVLFHARGYFGILYHFCKGHLCNNWLKWSQFFLY